MRKKRGFSLVEILVACVIFSLVMLGLVSVLVAAKWHIIHARERMISAEIGKFFIDPLQRDVKLENWGQIGNIFTTSGGSAGTQTINNTDFSAVYAISDIANTDLHRVITTITWAEPSL